MKLPILHEFRAKSRRGEKNKNSKSNVEKKDQARPPFPVTSTSATFLRGPNIRGYVLVRYWVPCKIFAK